MRGRRLIKPIFIVMKARILRKKKNDQVVLLPGTRSLAAAERLLLYKEGSLMDSMGLIAEYRQRRGGFNFDLLVISVHSIHERL